jgi:mono/diheme cytochrome c family protein
MFRENGWESKKIGWRQPPLVVRPGEALRHVGLLASLAAVGPVAAVLAVAVLAQKPAPKMMEDLPAGAMQAKATTACLECHEARIILQQRLSKAAWTKEVDKMVKWGAVVDGNDRDALIDYLSANFGPDQPPYEPPRSATAKK